MVNKIKELGISLKQKSAIAGSKSTVLSLKKSCAFDKVALSSEDNVLINTAKNLTNILYDELGVSPETDNITELLLSKENIIATIGKMFKNKLNLTKANFNDVVEYVTNNYDDTELNMEIKYSIKEIIIKLNAMGYSSEITISDLISSIDVAYAEAVKELSEYNKLLFNFDSMLGIKPLTKLGYSVKDKLRILNKKNIEAFCDFKLKDIEKLDKKNNLSVDEYRILPLGLLDNGYISFYILRYVKNGDLYTMIPRWHTYKINHLLKVKDTNMIVYSGDFDKLKKVYNLIYDNDRLFSPSSVFEEGYDEVTINKELDNYISSLGSVTYDKSKLYTGLDYDFRIIDLVDDWDLQYTSEEDLFKFIVNVSLINFYDNEEQGSYGNFDIKNEFINDIFYSVVYAIAEKLNNE